ncbi:MAG: HEAT repeat domain-containing protein [Myxococcota bacterium]
MSDPVKPEVLIARLTSNNEAWRVEAESRLLSLGEAAVEPLLKAMQHANPAVRLHAVHALTHLRDARAVPVVISALADSENLNAVAIAAEKALVEWGEPVKTELLVFATSGPTSARPRAVRALGKIGGEELAAPLAKMIDDEAPGVRLQAAVALATVAGQQAVEPIAKLLDDPDKWVRYGVAEALVKLGSARGEEVLRAAAADPEEQGQHTQFWAQNLLEEIEELRRAGKSS